MTTNDDEHQTRLELFELLRSVGVTLKWTSVEDLEDAVTEAWISLESARARGVNSAQVPVTPAKARWALRDARRLIVGSEGAKVEAVCDSLTVDPVEVIHLTRIARAWWPMTAGPVRARLLDWVTHNEGAPISQADLAVIVEASPSYVAETLRGLTAEDVIRTDRVGRLTAYELTTTEGDPKLCKSN